MRHSLALLFLVACADSTEFEDSTATITSRSLAPVADAKVVAALPTTNQGTTRDLQGDGSPVRESYLKFAVSGAAAGVVSATLELYVDDGSAVGPSVYLAGNTWTESSITWNNRPARTGAALDHAGAIITGQWLMLDVTSAITGDGNYTFVLATTSADGTVVSSREGAHPPRLTLTLCAGVRIAVGSDIQAAIDAAPAGTTFCMDAGTHRVTRILRPKTGNVFVGEGATTILDGGGTTTTSFDTAATDVSVKSLVVQRFADKGLRMGTRWLADAIEARNNRVGVAITGDGAVLQRSKLHTNGGPYTTAPSDSFGLTSYRATNAKVLDNEIYNNNPNCNAVDQMGGGGSASKFWESDGLLLDGNYWHDNFGIGVWLDGSNSDFVIRNERIENNTNLCGGTTTKVGSAHGIRIEVSCRTTIEDNVIVDNRQGGIFLDGSFGNLVQRNTIEIPATATIAMRSFDIQRDSPFGGLYKANCGGGSFKASNNRFVANDVTFATTTQWAGSQAPSGQDVSNNSFSANRYHVTGAGDSCATAHWRLQSQYKTWASWRTAGQDATGSCD